MKTQSDLGLCFFIFFKISIRVKNNYYYERIIFWCKGSTQAEMLEVWVRVPLIDILSQFFR